MFEVWGIFFTYTTVIFGLSVIILVTRDICHDKLKIRRQKKKDAWRGKKITKDGIDIDELAEGLSKAAPAAAKAGLSINEITQAMAALGKVTLGKVAPISVKRAAQSMNQATSKVDPYDELMDHMADRIAKQADKDIMDALGSAGRRGTIAGENIRAEFEGMINLKSEPRAESKEPVENKTKVVKPAKVRQRRKIR